MNDAGVAGLAAALCRAGGVPAPLSVEPLVGGRNNRVYKITAEDGAVFALKRYHQDPRDSRNRLQAEWSFLQYVQSLGVGGTPRPLARDEAEHAALYTFIPGIKPAAASAGLVQKAAEFVTAINPAVQRIIPLSAASEACFSLADHIMVVERRVSRVAELDPDAPLMHEAQKFVRNRLEPTWQMVRARIQRRVVGKNKKLQNVSRPIISPSDFGFHNALVDKNGHVNFLDFEYAGKDDPAKLICDFFCQPEVPVPLEYYKRFTVALESLGLAEEDFSRADELIDAYRIKWICILLNDFTKIGGRRRQFAAQDIAARANHQLALAERYVTLISI